VGRATLKSGTLLIGFALVALAVFAGVAIAGGFGAAGPAAGQPLTVQSASLTQDGQDLVWQVDLQHPFSPAGLRRDRRSLCLLVDRASDDSVPGQVCVAGPRHGTSAPQLLYTLPAGAGAVPIDATVSRSSDRELTASFLPASIGLQYRALRWQVMSTLTAAGCAPAVLGAGRCETLFPAKPELLSLHTPQLTGCVATGPDWVFHGPSNVHDIALTFDDGPWWEPPTSDFVNLLARLHAPATFFEIGEHISQYDPSGQVERDMLADGDMIGDHTWSHPDLVGLSAAEQHDEIAQAADAIRKATGFEPCLFRAPDGAVDDSVLAEARSLGMTTIQWDVDPRDWALPGESEIIANVVANAHNGGIVEEHFGGGPRYETLDALPTEIADLRKQGYQLVTLTQMLGFKLVYR
jgi:peptidoglycan-N-acetylglucosamine deacetylase